MTVFRHADNRFPFLWEGRDQPPARWHGSDEGPVQYFSDTADGAWAEFLRHEEIKDPDDYATVERAIWTVDLDESDLASPQLDDDVLLGDRSTYTRCREEARRLRAGDASGIEAPAAALLPGAAGGWRVDGGLVPGPARDGKTIVLFGRRPLLVGWMATYQGGPDASLVSKVRHFE